MKKILLIVVTFLILSVQESKSGDLSIPGIFQNTPVWCWVTCGEMVFRYYNFPNLNPGNNYQCALIAAYFGPNSPCWQNCFNSICITGGGTMTSLQTMIANYCYYVNYYYPNYGYRMLSSSVELRTLTRNEVKSQIDSGYPIIAGVNPGGYTAVSGMSAHVVVISGYLEVDGQLYLTVNDPFPYTTTYYNSDNPYLYNGINISTAKYRIRYDRFVSDLQWNTTCYDIN